MRELSGKESENILLDMHIKWEVNAWRTKGILEIEDTEKVLKVMIKEIEMTEPYPKLIKRDTALVFNEFRRAMNTVGQHISKLEETEYTSPTINIISTINKSLYGYVKEVVEMYKSQQIIPDNYLYGGIGVAEMKELGEVKFEYQTDGDKVTKVTIKEIGMKIH